MSYPLAVCIGALRAMHASAGATRAGPCATRLMHSARGMLVRVRARQKVVCVRALCASSETAHIAAQLPANFFDKKPPEASSASLSGREHAVEGFFDEAQVLPAPRRVTRPTNDPLTRVHAGSTPRRTPLQARARVRTLQACLCGRFRLVYTH